MPFKEILKYSLIITGGGRIVTIVYTGAGILLLEILKSEMPFPPFWRYLIKIPKVANLNFEKFLYVTFVWISSSSAVFYKSTRLCINIKPH
jgi:hypothetical protein